MLVFKFGGASVKNADAIRRIPEILKSYSEKLVVVVSAMDKTTNNMELLVEHFMNESLELKDQFDKIKNFHLNITNDLFKPQEKSHKIINELIDLLELRIKVKPSENYDFEYDQIVPFGELLSTTIINEYLNKIGIESAWLDIRNLFVTNSKHRDATVNFKLSQEKLNDIEQIQNSNIVITQGFIGSTVKGDTSTLGREGSDYTGAVLAYLFNAKSLTVWKDVEGILTADPQWKSNTIKLETISYKEAIELAFFGAKVIHPKTIKPLQNKKIPLYVKSFLNPELEGTIINDSEVIFPLTPVYIRKEKQVLVSIIPKDFSFIAEENMSEIFSVLAEENLKVNLMQNSAVSFSVCMDYIKPRFQNLITQLSKNFNIRYNLNLELITIRHYNDEAIAEMIDNRNVILEQRSRNTIQFVLD